MQDGDSSEVKVFYGIPSDFYEFVTRLDVTLKKGGAGICSMVFVSPTTALTAKHCTEDANVLKTLKFSPTKVYEHPARTKDISILVFEKPIYQGNLLPRLRQQRFPNGIEVKFVGFGNTSYAKAACYVKYKKDSDGNLVKVSCEIKFGEKIFIQQAIVVLKMLACSFLKRKTLAQN